MMEKEEVFVGRKKEIKQIKNILDDTIKNGCNTVFIKGEAGIGKTSLVFKVKQYASELGFNFLKGVCHEGISEPYLPFKEAFSPYLEERENSNENRIAFLGVKKDIEIKDNEMFNAQKKSTFYDTKEYVRKLAENNPLFVFLDDLQWADKATLEMLSYMSIKLTSSPIIFVGTYRPEDITDDHPLPEMIHRLSRIKKLDEIELGPLKIDNTRKMIEKLTKSVKTPSKFVDEIHDKTKGNPLFMKEITYNIIEEDLEISLEKHLDDIDKFIASDVIHSVIKSRIEKLDKKTIKTLKVASVIGESFEFDILSDILDIDEIETLDCIDLLINRNILYESDDKLNFSHHLIWKIIYDDLKEIKKKLYHKKVADSIEDLYADSLDEKYHTLASHYKRSKQYSEAVDYYVKAADKAKELYAHKDAIENYINILENQDLLNATNNVKVLEDLGDTYRIIGNFEKAKSSFYEAIEKTNDLDKKADIYRKIANCLEKEGNYEEALDKCNKGLEFVTEKNKLTILKLNIGKAWILVRMGEYNKAEKGLKENLSLAKDLESKKELSHIYSILGTIYWHKGKYERSVDRFDKALKIIKDDSVHKSEIYNNKGLVYLDNGNLEKALDNFKDSLNINKKIGNNIGIIINLNNIGKVKMNRGNFDEADDKFSKGIEKSKKIENNWCLGLSYSNKGDLYLYKNDPDKALKKFEETKRLYNENEYRYGLIYSHFGIAKAKLKQNQLDVSLKHGKKALGISKEINSVKEEAISHRIIGMVYREKREIEKAKSKFKSSEDLVKQINDQKELARLNYELGVLNIKSNQDENAKDHLEKAKKLFEEMGMNYWADECVKKLENI